MEMYLSIKYGCKTIKSKFYQSTICWILLQHFGYCCKT
ncbi:unnamed protein product [Nezara viridula]|uniref:Uncharacterized protein n=1 Tax=Nezara viridula TaxID=85310 RepID=A0A9P0MVK4_NEZVI|nr:unnamed protein product [Nezara viridula]